MIKGGAGAGSLVMSRTQAGWSANLSDYSFVRAPSKLQAPDSLLKVKPYFNSFMEDALLSADTVEASAKASESKVRYDLLARGLPALSFAAAANRVRIFDEQDNAINFDMEAAGKSSDLWPSEGHEGDRMGKWIHSDFKNVALPYVRPMYQAMIDNGHLKDSP